MKDLKTKYQGVYVRHQGKCRLVDGGRCNCQPSYFGIATDRATRRTVRTPRFPSIEAARNARADLKANLESGERTAVGRSAMTLTQAREKFCAAARDGRVLNKHGKPYKPTAVYDIENSLRTHVEPVLGDRRLGAVGRGDVQAIVNELQTVRSGSRVRSVVNSLRSLYAWAQSLEHVPYEFNPAQRVRLPAMACTPIERVADPAEFARLLAVVELRDAVAYGLAGYGMGRRAQIVALRWRDVDLDVGVLEWGVEWEARKYEASRRVVPVVPPLLTLLKRHYLECGRPPGEQYVLVGRWGDKSSTKAINDRPKHVWRAAGLEPITLQESRHTAATWLDAAGVSPKVASVLMGHAVPQRQQGAATITLARYTHALPADIERARTQLAGYLAERQRAVA